MLKFGAHKSEALTTKRGLRDGGELRREQISASRCPKCTLLVLLLFISKGHFFERGLLHFVSALCVPLTPMTYTFAGGSKCFGMVIGNVHIVSYAMCGLCDKALLLKPTSRTVLKASIGLRYWYMK